MTGVYTNTLDDPRPLCVDCVDCAIINKER